MINYYRHFHLRPKSSVRGLISKLDSQLRRKNLDDQEVLLILEAMYIFSHDYLKKIYDLSLKSKNPPPKWTRILNREKAKLTLYHLNKMKELIYLRASIRPLFGSLLGLKSVCELADSIFSFMEFLGTSSGITPVMVVAEWPL